MCKLQQTKGFKFIKPLADRKNILFICGTRNQTTQMHRISEELEECDSFFTPYYCDPPMSWLSGHGFLDFTILGNKSAERCIHYLRDNALSIDIRGRRRAYDLVVTCADIIIPKNIRSTPIVLVQEGMTDPEEFWYHAVRILPFLPRWLGSTSTMGMSGAFEKFCVASEGYRELFIHKGVLPPKITVTGIPNFDNCGQYRHNSFPYHNFVLVCTSDSRETFRRENRKRNIIRARTIAAGRTLIFKLHPNEDVVRATSEISAYAPEAHVYTAGNTEEMIANCDVLITEYSSTVYVGLALGKEVYSKFPMEELERRLPLQNGRAAVNIANVCRDVLGQRQPVEELVAEMTY